MRNSYLIIFFFITGCLGINTTRKLNADIKQQFINRLEGNSAGTGLSKIIELNGVYRYWSRDERGRVQTGLTLKDTFFMDILFYDDGSFVRNISVKDSFNSYNDYFAAIRQKGKDALFYKSNWWGVYALSGDTIKAQYLMHAPKATPWYTGEEWYLIKDRNTLQLIFAGDLGLLNGKPDPKRMRAVEKVSPVRFYPVNETPPSYGWLKKEKFFWRNEQDWELYMSAINK